MGMGTLAVIIATPAVKAFLWATRPMSERERKLLIHTCQVFTIIGLCLALFYLGLELYLSRTQGFIMG